MFILKINVILYEFNRCHICAFILILIADIIAGIMISFSKPFNIGERITLKNNNIVGIVEDITLRHTVIKCFNGVRTIIPNSIINKELIQK